MSDPLVIAGREFKSRLFLGTAGYPNRQVMLDALTASGTEMVTASIRRISLAGDDESLLNLIPKHIQVPAQYRRMPDCEGCCLHCRARTRGPRHQLDQTRSHWRPRAALPGYRRARARDRDVGIERLRRTALLHRGPGCLSQISRCGCGRRNAAWFPHRFRAWHL